MAHLHSIYDTDPHFSIDPVTRAIKNESTRKTVLVRGDHNSERFTFEMPRMVEGHDMSLSTRIEVHFINIASDKSGQSENVYIVDDMQISPNSEDESIVIFSWLISMNATRYNGTLAFAVSFVCLDGEKLEYAWSTAPYKNISITDGINVLEGMEIDYSDILAPWEYRLDELEFRVNEIISELAIVQETGESEVAVMSQKASTDAFVPKLATTDGDRVYIAKVNGETGLMQIQYGSPISWTIPARDAGGVVRVGTPVGDTDATNKQFVVDGFVAKEKNTSGLYQAYCNNAKGDAIEMLSINHQKSAWSIARRYDGGRLRVAAPVEDDDAATKGFVSWTDGYSQNATEYLLGFEATGNWFIQDVIIRKQSNDGQYVYFTAMHLSERNEETMTSNWDGFGGGSVYVYFEEDSGQGATEDFNPGGYINGVYTPFNATVTFKAYRL